MADTLKCVLCIAAFAGILAACSSDGPSDPTSNQDPKDVSGMVVSEPHTVTSTINSQSVRASVVETNLVAYASVQSGTFPDGLSAKITNKALGSMVVARIADGGFDPVPIEARVGDELLLSVTVTSGLTLSYTLNVPPHRPPIVVRTKPNKGRVDVALTEIPTAIFSEPIDPLSVTTASFRLLRSGVPVAGTLQISPDDVAVEFVPDAQLEPNTVYTLIIGSQIRDFDGETLGTEEQITFTTAAELPPQGPSSVTLVFQRTETEGAWIHIYSIHGDGSNIRQLTTGPYYDVQPSVSRDEKRIAFVRNGEIMLMNADGSDVQQLPVRGASPSWSPDGTKLVFADPATLGLSVVSTDGSKGVTHLSDFATGADEDATPSWSPDGRTIVFLRAVGQEFWRVYVMNADGSSVQDLGRNVPHSNFVTMWPCWGPTWSADSQRIAFAGPNDSLNPSIFTMERDGSAVSVERSFPDSHFVDAVTDWSSSGWIAFSLNPAPSEHDVYLTKNGLVARVTTDGRSSNASFITR